jgi:hypothetical protein
MRCEQTASAIPIFRLPRSNMYCAPSVFEVQLAESAAKEPLTEAH